MAPNITETVFALGAGRRVVGVSDYTVFPKEAAELPGVGALYNPNLEKIVSLEPDLVIIQQKHEKVEELCRRRNIAVLRVEMEGSTQKVFDAILALGDALGKSGRAVMLCHKMQTMLAMLEMHVAGRERVKTLICVDRSAGDLKGVYAPGSKGFLNDLLLRGGGDNIFSDVNEAYAMVSLEEIVRRAPEVIIETRPGADLSDAERAAIVDDWNALETVPAVKNGRVVVVTDDSLVVPGPRLAMAAARLARILHPEADDDR